MSIDIAWQRLSVADFVDNCGWFGWSPQMLSEASDLSESVYQLKQSLLVWQTLTTKDFFESNNWNGLSTLPDHISEEILVSENAIFSFTLPNSKFWQCFAWDSPANITPDFVADRSEIEIPEAAAEFTMTDLSQLF